MDSRKLFALSSLVMFLTVAQADDQADKARQAKFTPEAEAECGRRATAIDAELKPLEQHPWAGSYYFGDGLGVNARLKLAPKSGFTFIWRGCLGVYDRNYGVVLLKKDGGLKLLPHFENSQAGFRGFATDLIPVLWGERHYLIPTDEMVAFCNDVNSESEPRRGMHGMYFLRDGDHEKPIAGKPSVPKKYQAYMLDKPIFATITAVGDTKEVPGCGGIKFRTTKVTLDVGRAEKVQPGMTFEVIWKGENYLSGTAHVTTVDEHTSQAEYKQTLSGTLDPPQPEVGWKLTTGDRFGEAKVKQKAAAAEKASNANVTSATDSEPKLAR